MIRKIIVDLLRNNAGIGALVGTRIYPRVVPPDASKPAIAYQVISESRSYIMSGQDGLTRARVQLTIVAESIEQADATAEACLQALSGYSGEVNGETVYLVTLENDYDTPVADGESLRVLIQEYQIIWKEN